MDSILQQPNPTSFPGQSQVYTKVLGCTSTYRGDSTGSPVELGGRPSMQTATHRFQNISAILRELNQAGLRMQTVNDLLTMYVGAASQHALRTTFVPKEEAVSFDKEIVLYWSQLAGRDVTSPLFHIPSRMGGLGVGSALQRHASAPWTAWQSIIPTLMEATGSPDLDSLFAPTPILRGQLHQLQTTLAQQMNAPSLLLKSLGLALRTHGSQKALVKTIQQTTHQQLLANLSTNPIQKAILRSQTAKNTGAHLQQPNSEAYEADRCFQVTLARRLMLVHPAASHATNISPTCPNVSAAKRTCACPIDTHQLHCMTWKSGGGVDQRPSALARCLADLIATHTGTKAYIEQSIPGLAQPTQPGQTEGARMDIVVELRGNTYYIDTAIVTPFPTMLASYLPPAAAQATWPNAKKRKSSTDTLPHQPGPIHPRVHRETGIPRPKVHQTPLRRHGPPTNSRPGRLGGHSNHPAQQHLQTTAPGGHHVTAMTFVSSTPFTSARFSAMTFQPSPQISTGTPGTSAPFVSPLTSPSRKHPPHIHECGPTKHTRQFSFRSRFSSAVFLVISHAHHAAATEGPRSAERTLPGHTDAGLLHWVRDLPQNLHRG